MEIIFSIIGGIILLKSFSKVVTIGTRITSTSLDIIDNISTDICQDLKNDITTKK